MSADHDTTDTGLVRPPENEIPQRLDELKRLKARPLRPQIAHAPDGTLTPPVHFERTALFAAFATRSGCFTGVHLTALEAISRRRGADPADDPRDAAMRTNSALALVAAVEPRNEVEAALAVQMAGSHSLSLEFLGLARQAESIEQVTAYGGLAVKMQRTFAAQMEALAKLRSAGKQIVEVNHVHTYVGAGGQAIIGDVHHGGAGGDGGRSQIGHQPHALSSLGLVCATRDASTRC